MTWLRDRWRAYGEWAWVRAVVRRRREREGRRFALLFANGGLS